MQVYDKESSIYYSKRFSSKGGKYIDTTEKTLLAKYVKGPSFLEVGTATGRFIGFAERMGWDYTGLDISGQMLRLSKNNGCKLVQGDAENIPVRSSSFDTVVCLHTFHFLPNPIQCIKESYRVLKDGGHIILIYETDNWLRRLSVRTGLFESDQYYFTVQEVASMMENSGLRFVEGGSVLKFPMEAYRKTPLTPAFRILDRAPAFPRMLATLGFVVGQKKAKPAEGYIQS